MLQHHADDVFIFQYVIDTDIIEVSIDTFQHMEDAFHDVSFLTEWLIQHFHPTKIRINAPQSLFPILRQNGYYPRGLQYQKCIEPLRKQLQDSIFDSEGYIIDQGSMHSVPFGWFHTDEKGCGWIAAYNLLKYNGKYEDMQTVIHDLEKHMFLGKVFGQELVYLIAYLKQKGLNVHLSLPSKVACMHAIKQYDSGILVYSHARG